MVGVKGSGGPPPKRASQRRRTNTPVSGAPVQVETSAEVLVPRPNPKWHKIARMWYDSLGKSGQSVWYTTSDWCVAYSAAELLSRELHPKPIGNTGQVAEQPIVASSMMAFLKACTMLLATEGDRRRASIELQRAKVGAEEVPDVSELARYRQRLQSS